MKILLRFSAITLILLILISLLIIVPAYIWNILALWQISFLIISYFIFFLATVWRTTKFGNLAKKSEDLQNKSLSGRLASLVAIIGLGGVHWLAIYDYHLCQGQGSSLMSLTFTVMGISLIVAAIIINQIAVTTLGQFFDRLIIKEKHQLITTGIYSQVRHPIYTSYLLLFTGFCILLHSLLSLMVLAIVSWIWFGNRIILEEEMLTQKFGETYQQYAQQTKRLIPLIY